jgi:hypothetical protein
MMRALWAIGMGLCITTGCSDDAPRSAGPPAHDAGHDADANPDADASPVDAGSEQDAAPDQADGQVLPECPTFAAPVERGRLSATELDEISGLAVSRNNPRVLWMHNDSGDSARIFAVRDDGTYLGSFALEGALAIDWEDLATGPGREPGTTALYVADIGNNELERLQVIVYRVTEPAIDPDLGGYNAVLRDVERFPLRYPDGPSGEIEPDRGHNAEALFVEPPSGDLIVVTKALGGARVYRARAPLSPSGNALELVTVLGFGQPPLGDDALVTAGDLSPAGEVALRTQSSAFLWRGDAAGVPHALEREACPIPLAFEPQGETLAFLPDGSGYFTVSEGDASALYYYARQ